MAASNTQVLEFDRWDGGEFGSIAPDLAAEGTFTGSNVVVYRDGHIGPRPGLKLADIGEDLPNGPLQGFGFVPTPLDTEPSHWVIVQGDEVWSFRPSLVDALQVDAGPDVTLTAPLADGEFVWWKESTRQLFGRVYFATSSGVYAVKMNTWEMEQITPDVTGTDIEIYKDRLFVASDTVARTFYSDVADYDTWPVDGFFDSGASWPISHLAELRDGLCIFTPGGNWLLTGGSPDTWVLRRVSDALPAIPNSIVKTNDDIYFTPSARNAPIMYNGSYGDELALRNLENWKPLTSTVAGIQSYGNRDILFCSASSELLWRKNMVWTKHEFAPEVDDEPVTVGPYLTRYFDDVVLIAANGDETTPPSFYFLMMDLNRPAFVGEPFSSPGDGSDTPVDAWFSLPDFFSQTGEEVRVRRVIVDFTKYDILNDDTNNITCEVKGLARFRHPGEDAASTYTDSWTEATTEGSADGIRDRAVFRGGGPNQFHGGFRLSLRALRGVKIDRILVDYETQPYRPRS